MTQISHYNANIKALNGYTHQNFEQAIISLTQGYF